MYKVFLDVWWESRVALVESHALNIGIEVILFAVTAIERYLTYLRAVVDGIEGMDKWCGIKSCGERALSRLGIEIEDWQARAATLITFNCFFLLILLWSCNFIQLYIQHVWNIIQNLLIMAQSSATAFFATFQRWIHLHRKDALVPRLHQIDFV